MKSKNEILSKFDYMKAYSYNFILTEKTNTELEHQQNVGRIDKSFYKIFSWQIMGKQKERQLSENQSKDVIKNGQIVSNSAEPPSRYVAKCYFKTKTVPTWYTESLLIYVGSTKRRYEEKVHFKNKLQPYYWSETMTTQMKEDKTTPPVFRSEAFITMEKSNYHYISLEPQQQIVAAVTVTA
ncbi:uncharacterized protein LOC132703849 isoform X2 [Cylas formicarius]|uniref:uncharacterized protein LOC132703849 isoform X2 n=1 Tax=Cylas formicarius TaxID=197179 RepID=UPI0029584CDE|nr:uncharacterized protein LOC132703849 isoform X2 [Cylas formicarius]